MKAIVPGKRHSHFQFVLDELLPLRPAVKQMFGFSYVYLEERLLLSLRESRKQPQYNGVWLYTEAAHIDSLRREFPQLPRRSFWKSAKSGSGWVILAAATEGFEECAFRACELILAGDRRIGRLTRGRLDRAAGTADSGAVKSRRRPGSRSRV